jgi:hypothetical protein
VVIIDEEEIQRNDVDLGEAAILNDENPNQGEWFTKPIRRRFAKKKRSCTSKTHKQPHTYTHVVDGSDSLFFQYTHPSSLFAQPIHHARWIRVFCTLTRVVPVLKLTV